MKRTDLRLYLTCSLLSTGLLIGSSDPVQAQLTGMNAEEFRYIEQPLALKAGITAAGIGLMSFELWWFLFSRAKAKPEKASQTAATSKEGETESAVLDSPSLDCSDSNQTVEKAAYSAASEALLLLRNSTFPGEESESDFSQLAADSHSCTHSGIEKASYAVLVEDERSPQFSASFA